MNTSRLFRCSFIGFVVLLTVSDSAAAADQRQTRPNIVVILADDLGLGDVGATYPRCKIPTPHLNRLASQGMIFLDAHSGSSVCTPTRYGLLTGRYCWRSPLKSGVLFGYSPRLIEPGRQTVASLLKANGYHTACIGKWHLGMDWPLNEGGIASSDADARNVDYTKPILNGPLTVGFAEYIGISASLDMPPFIWIHNDRTVGLPTVEKTWIRKGLAHPDFEPSNVLPEIGKKTVAYLAERATKSEPFFLYVPLTSPHTPIVPTAAWQGKSGLNAYADFVMETDAVVGNILEALETFKLAENTLVIFTSDNGCSPQANIPELHKKGHDPSAGFRGHKADIFEGGHRVPFIVRWPGVVRPGSSSQHLVCLTDIARTATEAAGVPMPADSGEDSFSLIPILKGEENPAVRDHLVHHSINGSFAIREPRWKLNLCPDSGGWSPPRPGRDDTSSLPRVQLYNLNADPAETNNLASAYPELVTRLTKRLESIVADGRSTPGPKQRNTTPVTFTPAPRPQKSPAPKP